ncbi:MAG: AraC family transcriptional regulator [Bacteroidales bacterium]|nr:AraC family transcriptional regulator [Bacteroidales bacterium]
MPQDYFIIVNNDAKIFDALPEVRKHVLDKNYLSPYPYILEFAKQKFSKIKRGSLDLHINKGIEFCYVHKGKYEWVVEDKTYVLFPGDAFITCPWENHGSKSGFLDLGILSWIIIKPNIFSNNEDLDLGYWSKIPLNEQRDIGNILKHKSCHVFRESKLSDLFSELFTELIKPTIGSSTRVGNCIEELFIHSVRGFTNSIIEKKCEREFSIEKLKDFVLQDISRAWTIEEMAEHMNYGITSFIEHCKNNTGLTPINFLIEMRILKSIEMIKSSNVSLTNISYDCGFSSIQHFSDTFKKHTGFSPSQYKQLFQIQVKDLQMTIE